MHKLLSIVTLILGFLAGSANAQKLERAVLAFGSTGPNLTPFWVGREAGLYKQYGLDVDVVFFRGSTIAINALLRKTLISAHLARALRCSPGSAAWILC